MKELDISVEDLQFRDFLSSRYLMSAKVNAKNLWDFSKENDLSFFNLSLLAILNSVNKVDSLKRRIIDGKVVEFEYLDAVCPLMDEGNKIYKEACIKSSENFDSLLEWYGYVEKLKKDTLDGSVDAFNIDLSKRDELGIVNCSCIPWVDFDVVTNAVASGDAIQPLITWGKVNSDGMMSVSITVSHIFVFGRDLSYFFQYLQESLDTLSTVF